MNQIKNMMNTDTTVNKTVLITTPYKGTTLNLKVTYYPSYANAYIFRHNIDKEEITSLHKLENKINEMLHWTEYINEKLSGKLTLIEMDIDIYNCGDNVMVVHYNFNSMTGKNIFGKDVNVTNVIIRPNLNDLLDVSNELERKLNKSNA